MDALCRRIQKIIQVSIAAAASEIAANAMSRDSPSSSATVRAP
jgi:hypothetical protein